MLSVSIIDNKLFMNKLLRENIFDNFEVRKVEIQTFTHFEISGIIDKNFYTVEEQENIERNFCIWSELKPIIFNLIKGNKLPGFIKIIFSLDENTMQQLSDNAAAMFLNISFENNAIVCTSGYSQKTFTLDKKVENCWEEYILKFFKDNNIPYQK